jgi:hypothetical protein
MVSECHRYVHMDVIVGKGASIVLWLVSGVGGEGFLNLDDK